MNGERTQVEVVVAYLSYFPVFLGGTEENHKKILSQRLFVSVPRFEPRASGI
jgi:hypothetical protein